MSFNLDRFRYEREKKKNDPPTSKDDDGGCTSSDSEKENKHASAAGCPPSKKQERGVAPVGRQAVVKICGWVGEEEVLGTSNGKGQKKSKMDKKLAELQELFPQKDRDQLLEVIESTSTLEGAVATCLTRFGDDDEGRPDSPSSPNRISSSLAQMRNSGKLSDISQDELVVPPNKRRRKVSPSGRVDSEKEEEEPVWEEVNAMVGSLQRKFPGLDKKELRAVLREHNWCLDDASEVLHMFSESAEQSNSPEAKGRNPKSAESHRGVKSGKKVGTHKTAAPSLSGWLVTPVTHPPLAAVKPRSATSSAAKRKRQAAGGLDSGSEDSEPSLSSEFEGASSDSDLDSDSDGPDMQLRSRVLGFFQEASVDELTLMTACSLKKAQKIVALRPFDTWQDLKEILHKGNGLSEDLLWGCRVVLKEREVVLGLMKKCEKITQKMAKDVASVIERRTGSLKQPAVLNSRLQLKPYQLIGLNWLVLLHKSKLSGILADEMGLGKTVQVISFLASLYQEGIHGPHLITVPSSTLDNWIRELKLWCPSLKVLVYYGSVEDRRYLRYDILNGQVDFNIILTTYNLAIGNANDRSLFRKLKLQNAVFDEGHMLKNMNSLRYRHLMAINAKHRLLLTGTPLQNNLLEFMSLLNFIMPSMFSSSTSQISKMFSMKSSEEQSRFERDRIAQAKLIMKPFILRRVKSEVLKQLPAKEEKLEWCVMTENQRHLYCALQEKLKRSASGEKKELCNAMMQLRKMANHPLLHRQCYTSERLAAMSRLLLKEPTHHDADPALIQEDMEVMSDFELHQLCQLYPSLQGFQLTQDQLLDSGKFHVLSQLLGTIKDKGDRVVLFSQFTMMLDIVEVLLQHLSHRYVRLDGSTPIPDRMVLIDQFNTEPEIFVFLLSTRAGGLGINLTTANVVILHDIDCNPYNDKQAEDRCHRVGQTRTVQVIKLISQDSIEDCMLQVSQKKLKLEQDMTAAEEGDEGRVPEDMASLLKASLGL